MSYAVALPLGGYAGWRYLQRTAPMQKAALSAQVQVQRDRDYFRERIGSITSAEQLVADRRLLGVALGAFGLDEDINNRFFIRKVLEEGTLQPDALAMRLSDRRYREFSAAFGFGDFSTPRTALSDFADRILTPWHDRQFEAAVGAVDENLRLALNAEREITRIAQSDMSAASRWFTLMGQPPLRRVLEGAFGLPPAFGAINIDRQKDIFTEKARAAFGSGDPAQFADPDRMEALIRRFLARAQIDAGPAQTGRGAIALSLLQVSAPRFRPA